MRAIVLILTLFMFALNQAAAAEITGTYVRADNGGNGKIISKPVYLSAPHVVLRVTGAPDGFCLMRRSEGSEEALCTGGAIIGKTLLPGTYTVFPSPPTDKQKESVSVYTQPVSKKKR